MNDYLKQKELSEENTSSKNNDTMESHSSNIYFTDNRTNFTAQRVLDESSMENNEIAQLSSFADDVFSNKLISANGFLNKKYDGVTQLAGVKPTGFTLTDEDLADFMARLKKEVTSVADKILVSIGETSDNCPYISYWFQYYSNHDAAYVNRALLKYIPALSGTSDKMKAIELIVKRVQQGLMDNLNTGSLDAVPDGVPKNLEEFSRDLKDVKVPKDVAAQLCWGGNDDRPQRRNVDNARGREQLYRQNPNLQTLRAWKAQLRTDVGGRFPELSTNDKAYTTNSFRFISGKEEEYLAVIEAQERRDRADATSAELDRLRLLGTLQGEANQNIIRDYTNVDTNKAEAYFNNPVRNRSMRQQESDDIISLQEALLRSNIAPDQELWRGAKTRLIGGVLPGDLVPNQIYQETAFLSTSRRRSVAKGFGDLIVKITVNRTGRDIISLGGDEYGGGEDEVLFPARSRFRYIGTDQDGNYEFQEV